MAQNDIFRMTLSATFQNSVYMNTLTLRQKSTSDPTAADRLALADAWMGVNKPNQSNGINWTAWTLVQLWGTGVTPDSANCRRVGGLQYGGIFTPPTIGAISTGDALPPQSAMVVTLVTGFTGRRKRGRIYLFGYMEADQAAGTWIGTTMTGVGSRLSGFFNTYAAGGTNAAFELGVWSERTATGCVPGPNGKGHTVVDVPHPELAYTPVTGFTLRSIVYTQRRRVAGMGR